jgi:hypothetical protein
VDRGNTGKLPIQPEAVPVSWSLLRFVDFKPASIAVAAIRDRFRRARRATWGERRHSGRVCKCSVSSIKGGYYAFQTVGHGQRGCFDPGRLCRMGSKRHSRKDARPHHAKDAPGEEHRTGSIRVCAGSPQAE